MTFSPQLIERFTKHFYTKRGVELTSEQANEYLRSYAELFLVFAREIDGRSEARRLSARDDRAETCDSTGVSNTRGTLQIAL